MDYWIAIDKKKIGPLSLDDVRSRKLDPNVLVWHNGLATWCRADQLPELAGALSSTDEAADDSVVPPPQPSATNPQPQQPQQFNMPAVPPQSGAPLSSRPTYLNRPPEPIPEKPTTYLGWCIAAIIFCCMPFAIVALIFSIKVSSRYNKGDYAAAQKASERAELWLIISIVAGLVAIPFQIVLTLM